MDRVTRIVIRKEISSASPIFAIYSTPSSDKCGSEKGSLSIAIWGDGCAVFSASTKLFGAPYKTQAIPLSECRAFFSTIESLGTYNEDLAFRPQELLGGPSSLLLARDGAKCTRLISPHEFYEQDSHITCTETGARGEIRLSRFYVFKDLGHSYLHFRLVWAELRMRAESLVYRHGGQHVVGEFESDFAMNAFWQEQI